MQEDFLKRMPTGLTSLDPVFEGGVPLGSLMLLLGEIGAGNRDFVYTSIINLSLKSSLPEDSNFIYPKEIHYVTVSKVREDIKREIELSFSPDLLENFEKIHFDDLSNIFFDSSVVPFAWYSNVENVLDRMERRKIRENVLASLSDTLTEIPHESLVIVDSLTEMASQSLASGNWGNLTAYLRGMQRISKSWGTTIYLILTKGVLNQWQELEIADAVDAVLHFKWEDSAAARRQRIMYFEKFRGVMIHLEEKDLVKFSVRVTPGRGFEVSNIRVIV